MIIVTLTCPNCGTIVAGNELERNRVMKCPAIECEEVIRFGDLPEDHQDHYVEHRDAYRI